MVMTYNSLVLQIKAEAERTGSENSNVQGTGFFDQIPNFIMFAQQRMCRDSKSLLLEQYVVGTFIAGNPVIPKPGRWRRSITFNYGTGDNNTTVNIIQLRSYEFLRMYWPDPVTTGLPLFYSDYGFDHLLIAPTPSAAYPFEYGYLELPQPITASNQVNSLTNLAPDVLFAACMVEATQFLKNFSQSSFWEQEYQTKLSSFNQQDDLRIIDRTADRRAD